MPVTALQQPKPRGSIKQAELGSCCDQVQVPLQGAVSFVAQNGITWPLLGPAGAKLAKATAQTDRQMPMHVFMFILQLVLPENFLVIVSAYANFINTSVKPQNKHWHSPGRF